MALPTASDNPYPSLLLVETAAASVATPAAGRRRLLVDPADNVLKWKDEAGLVSPIGAVNKWDATTAPAVTDDSGDGYAVGSRWIDTTNDKEYVCLDASVGAAVWTETTAAGGGGGSDAWTEIVKSTDQTVTNSGILVDDSLLTFAATSGDVYHVEMFLLYSGNDTTGDFKCNFALPTASGWFRFLVPHAATEALAVSTGEQMVGWTARGTDLGFGTDASHTTRMAQFELMFRCGATASFTFRFANNTAAAGRESTTKAGSVLRYRKLSPI